MGLYYRLDYKNNKNHLNQKDSVPVIIDYYYKGKRTKVSTGVVCDKLRRSFVGYDLNDYS